MDIFVCLLTAIVAYLLGSIPSGYLAGRLKGVDIRTIGSGNIGATNVLRTLGRPAGITVLVLDGMKGWLAPTFIPDLVGHWLGRPAVGDGREYLTILAALSVILGHNYTCWLKFKGGKGIATSAGVLAALVPTTLVVGLVTFILVCWTTRYVSAGSIAAAAVMPVASAIFHLCSARMVVIVAVMGVLAIYKHKANIQRLLNGTEPKMGVKKTAPPPEVDR